jgi:hypothetical protein
MIKIENFDKLLSGFAVVLAYTMIDPLMEDLQDTFGKSLFYHPVSLWVCITTLVYTQTSSVKTGVLVVAIYEGVKALWRLFKPEPPELGRLKKLLHRVQNKEDLSDSDLAFLNSHTPNDITVSRSLFQK